MSKTPGPFDNYEPDQLMATAKPAERPQPEPDGIADFVSSIGSVVTSHPLIVVAAIVSCIGLIWFVRRYRLRLRVERRN